MRSRDFKHWKISFTIKMPLKKISYVRLDLRPIGVSDINLYIIFPPKSSISPLKDRLSYWKLIFLSFKEWKNISMQKFSNLEAHLKILKRKLLDLLEKL